MASPTPTGDSLRERLLACVRQAVGDEQFDKCLGAGARFRVGGRGERVDVLTPSTFGAEWLRRRFGKTIRDAAQRALGVQPEDVHFTASPEDFDRPSNSAPALSPPALSPLAPARPAPARSRRSESARRLSSLRHRLDNFIVGESNRLAHAAAMRLVEDPPQSGVSPLCIHGGCGLGKTHLLQGLAAHFIEARPGSRVLYMTGEAFTNAFIMAVRNNRVNEFRSRHRSLDLLCIDDVHFLASKTATQTEFLHTFNALGLEGARIALVSDEHPGRIRSFTRELASRFMAGMVVELREPDAALRERLVHELAHRRGLPIDDDAVRMLASRPHSTVRELEGALTTLDAVRRISRSTEGAPIDAAFVASALGETRRVRPRRPLKPEHIARVVADELAVDLAEVLGSSRHRRVVLARSAAAALARELTTCSFPEIARALGRPSHSSVVSAVKRLEKQLESDARCDAGPAIGEVRLADLLDRLRRVIAEPARSAA